MNLTTKQRIELDGILNTGFDNQELQRLITFVVEVDPESIVPQNATKPVIVESLLTAATRPPGKIPQLIESALAMKPGIPNLQTFIANYPEYDPAKSPVLPLDHYSAYFLQGNMVFLGRNKLRKALRSLHEDLSPPVIFIVKGERKTGKTYSAQFIGYLAEMVPKFGVNHKIIFIDLDQYVFHPYDIAVSIGRKIKADINSIPKPEQENSFDKERTSRYINLLCDWIHGEIDKTPNTIWWFILDGFRLRELLAETKDMINALAFRIQLELRQCRFVLFNYGDVLAVPKPLVEEIELPGREDLFIFFKRFTTDKGIILNDNDIYEIVDEILEQVNQATTAAEDWLPNLNQAVDTSIQKLFV